MRRLVYVFFWNCLTFSCDEDASPARVDDPGSSVVTWCDVLINFWPIIAVKLVKILHRETLDKKEHRFCYFFCCLLHDD